jgi:hypothetical protein
MDRVQLTKYESTALGGQDSDALPFPAPLDPQEDAIEAAGVYLQDVSNRDENVLIARSGDDMTFKDVNNSGGLTLSELVRSVSKVGTPVNNELAVWTGDGTLEGEADLTYDGTTFSVSAIMSATKAAVAGPIRITEIAAPDADQAGKGQIWCKDNTPNDLYFRDDAGNDHLLSLTETDYAKLTGRAGGQILQGGTEASQDLTLVSTASSTRGHIYLGAAQTSAFDETNGRLGIGIAAPDTLLHLWGATAGTVSPLAGTVLTVENSSDAYLSFLTTASDTAGILFGDPDDNDVGIIKYDHSNNSLSLGTAASVVLTIDQYGFVGIKESSPLGLLHVKTTDTGVSSVPVNSHIILESIGQTGMTILSGATYAGVVAFGDSGSTSVGQIRYEHDGDHFEFYTGGQQRAALGSVGLGIGIEDPDTLLHVYENTAGTVTAAANTLATLENSTDAYLSFLTPNTATSGILFGDPEDNDVGFIKYDHSSNTLSFTDGTTGTKTLAELAAGGGGDVSVSGTPANDQIAVWTNSTTIEGTSALTFDGGYLAFVGSGYPTVWVESTDSSGGTIRLIANSTNYYELYMDDTDALRFYNGSYAVMSLGIDGDVGINVSDPGARFHVRGDNLGGTAGNSVDAITALTYTNNEDEMQLKAIRHTTASTWESAWWRLQRVVDGSTTPVPMGYIGFGSYTDDLITFGENTTEYMRIDGDGNVGIGTNTPSNLLSVYGGDDEDTHDDEIIAYFGSKIGDEEYTGIGFGGYTVGVAKTAILHQRTESYGRGKLHLCGDNTVDTSSCDLSDAILTVDGITGNVGIGTASPDTLLEIEHAAADAHHELLKLTENSWSASSGKYKSIVWEDKTGNIAAIGAQYTSGTSKASIDFHSIYNSGYKTESDVVMRINGDGNVGIGETTPTHKLHIKTTGSEPGDGIFVEDAGTSAVAPYIKVRGDRTDGNQSTAFAGRLVLEHHRTDAAMSDNYHGFLGAILFGANHTSGSADNIVHPASIGAVAEGTFSAADSTPTGLVFLTGSTTLDGSSNQIELWTGNQRFGTERMRIDNTGNVGIGTSSPQGKLHVNTATAHALTPHTSYDELVLENTASCGMSIFTGYPTGGGRYGGIAFGDEADADAAAITYDHQLDKMYLNVNAGIRMTIDSDGDVGIGTTSPGRSLHVQSTTSAYGMVRLMRNSGTAGEASMSFYEATGTTDAEAWVVGVGGWSNTSDFVIGQNGVKLMIEDSTGNVGIGTTSPSANLHVYDGTEATIRIDTGGSDYGTISCDSYGRLTILSDAGGTGDFGLTLGAGSAVTVITPSETTISGSADYTVEIQSPFGNTPMLDFKSSNASSSYAVARVNGGDAGVLTLSSDPDNYEADSEILFYVDGTFTAKCDDNNYFCVGSGYSASAGEATFCVKMSEVGAWAARISNTNTATTAYGLAIRAGASSPSSNSDCRWIYFLDNGDNSKAYIGYSTSSPYAAFYASSDARLKANIEPTQVDGLDIINRLELNSFDFIDQTAPHQDIGYVAQQVQDVYPAMVAEHEDGMLHVSDSCLIPVLVKAVQQLTERIKVLEARAAV